MLSARVARITVLTLLIVGVGLAVPLLTYVKELIQVDKCLDSGGSFNYTTDDCDSQQNHQYVPFGSRHPVLAAADPWLALGAASAFAASAVVAFVALRKAPSNAD